MKLIRRIFILAFVALQLGLILAGPTMLNPSVTAQQSTSAWSDPINLSKTGGTVSPTLVIDSSGVFHAVWNEVDYGTGYARSTDGGITWSDSIPASFPFLGSNPKLFADQNGYIHAFWLAERDQLFYSKSPAESFGTGYSWVNPQVIAQSAIDFDVIIYGDTIQVAYLRNFETPDAPSGVYVRRSTNGGGNWSAAANLYASRYFRNLTPQNAHIDIERAGSNEIPNLYVAWDQPYLKEIFMSTSADDGQTWSDENELVSGPDITSALAAPNQLSLVSAGPSLLRIWQTGLSNSNECQLNYQILAADGSDWSPVQQTSSDPTPCAASMQLFPLGDSQQLVMLMITRENAFLIAWNGEQWSELQAQPSLTSFISPYTFDLIEFSCQYGAYFNDTLSVIGCDTGDLRDSWILQRSLADLDQWFPKPGAWSNETLVYSDSLELTRPIIVSDNIGQMYAFWSQQNPEPANQDLMGTPSNQEIYYSFWDGEVWFEPVSFIDTPDAGSAKPALNIQNNERINLVWEGIPSGEIYYAWAGTGLVLSRADWSSPVRIPAQALPASAPTITTDAQGNLYIAYAVPLNESRGVYLSISSDEGASWSDPIQVFDAAAENWQMIDNPQIAVSSDGTIHVLFTQFSTSGEIIPTGLYYAQSHDGGESWDTSKVIDEKLVVWSEITALSGISLQRAWQEKIGNSLVLEQEFSQDGGQIWQGLSDLPSINEGAGSVDFFLDPTNQLHWLQVSIGSEQLATLNHAVWQGTNWESDDPVALSYTPLPGPGTLSGTVSSNGLLGAVYTSQFTEPTSGELQYGLSFLTKEIQLPEEVVVPIDPTTTSEAIVQATASPTPDLTPEPTATVNYAELPNPPVIGSSSSGNILIGLIIGGFFATLLVIAPFGIRHFYKQRHNR